MDTITVARHRTKASKRKKAVACFPRRKRNSRLAITLKISLPPFASLTVEYRNDPAKEKDCSATIRMSCVFRVVAAFCR
jgi:hypothetical protein